MLELKKDRDITFSFVVHVRDAAGDVAAFWSNLKGVADQFEATYEVLFVDDGSVDETPGILQELVEGSDCVRAITLSRCFGYEAAVTAGADLATGSAILCMPCADRGAVDVIAEMVSLWRRGASVVAAMGDTAGREKPSAAVRYLMSLFTAAYESPVEEVLLVDRSVRESLRDGRSTSPGGLGPLIHWAGFDCRRLTYVSRRDASAWEKAFPPARVAIGQAVRSPSGQLALGAMAGAILLAITIVYGLVNLLLWPFGATSGGYANFVAALIGLVGLGLLLLGGGGVFLIRSVARTVEDVQVRPPYVVSGRSGFAEPPAPRRDENEWDEQADQPRAGDITLFT